VLRCAELAGSSSVLSLQGDSAAPCAWAASSNGSTVMAEIEDEGPLCGWFMANLPCHSIRNGDLTIQLKGFLGSCLSGCGSAAWLADPAERHTTAARAADAAASVGRGRGGGGLRPLQRPRLWAEAGAGLAGPQGAAGARLGGGGRRDWRAADILGADRQP